MQKIILISILVIIVTSCAKITKQEIKVSSPSELKILCTVDSDCTKYISHNNCQLYCVNKEDSNNDIISRLEVTCDSTLWDPPGELNCICIDNKCQLVEPSII